MTRVSGSLKLTSIESIANSSAPERTHGSGARHLRLSTEAWTLPEYDVRLRRERSQRRLFLAMGRHIARLVGVHAADALSLLSAVWIAQTLITTPAATAVALIQVAVVLLSLGSRGAYQAGHARRDPARIIAGVFIGAATLAILSAWPPRLGLSAAYLSVFSGVSALLLLAVRRVIDVMVRKLYSRGIGLRRGIIIGNPREVRDVVEALERDASGDHFVIGAVSPTLSPDGDGVLGDLRDLEGLLLRHEPAELILATALSGKSLQEVSGICERCGVAMLALPNWNAGLRGWAEPVQVGPLAAFWLHPRRLELPALMVKRVTDLTLTSVALVVALPLIAILAIAIKLDSPGPVFFRQRRVGLGGREFMLWKLRSMLTHAERRHDDVAHLNAYADARLFKLRNDPRVTRVGRFLRRFSLDELPQLFNILAGDMSLVGPRPPVPSEVEKYESHHYVRLTVVPGLTGPWQTSGRNLITDFEEVVRIERAYIEEWSLGLDLRIMAKTLVVVLSGKGAY